MSEIIQAPFMAMPSIYCYPFPETLAVMDEVQKRIPREIFKVTGSTIDADKLMKGLFYEDIEFPVNDICFTKDDPIMGELHRIVVNPDGLSKVIMEKVQDKYSEIVSTLTDFKSEYPWAYTTPGSSGAIFKILAKAKVDGYEEINVVKGDYQGYKVYAETLGLKVVEHKRLPYADKTVKPGLWFISNPSAIDGNIISQFILDDMCVRGHEFIYDLSYAGMTKPYIYFLHRNVKAVVFSMSKPFGVFRFRMGGFVFSREEIPSLFGNKWFNDTTRMLQAWKLLEKFGFHKLYQKYRPVQEALVKGISEQYMFDMQPSDVFLMAYFDKDAHGDFQPETEKMMKPFKRVGKIYRYCLTPYFEEREKYLPPYETEN